MNEERILQAIADEGRVHSERSLAAHLETTGRGVQP
jgi:hypothetical protein